MHERSYLEALGEALGFSSLFDSEISLEILSDLARFIP